jgi:hypothetical protein
MVMAEIPPLKTRFLESSSSGLLYDLGGHGLIVASAQPIADNPLLLNSLHDPKISGLVLTDTDDVDPVIAEMKAIRLQSPPDRFFMHIHFRREKPVSEIKELQAYPALRADIAKTVQSLSPVFNENWIGLGLRYCQAGLMPYWHQDFNSDKRYQAVRTLSPEGTRVASGLIEDHCIGLREDFRVSECAHAGQGIYLLRGNVVHATPQTKSDRFIYALYGVNF